MKTTNFISLDVPEDDDKEDEVDDALDGSFPASDPPPWTLG